MPSKIEAPVGGVLNRSVVRKYPEGTNVLGELQAMFDLITSEKLNQKRSELSAIFSTRDEYGQAANLGEDFLVKPIGEGGSREAFTIADFRVRDLIATWVDEIVKKQKGSQEINKKVEYTPVARLTTYEGGITVEQNAAGVIVSYSPEGTDTSKPAVAFGSHIDTVKRAGKCDGQDGVAAGICVLESLILTGTKPTRPMKFIAVTGEESGLFSFSGSQLLVRGIQDNTALDVVVEAGFPLREGLERWANYFGVSEFLPELLVNKTQDGKVVERNSLFQKGRISHHIELHADANSFLKDQGAVVGVVKEIMGADRRIISIDQVLRLPKTPSYERGEVESVFDKPQQAHYQVKLKGKSGHSGSTPMVGDYDNALYQIDLSRQDVMYFFDYILKQLSRFPQIEFSLSNLSNNGQAINKISGDMKFIISLFSDTSQAIDDAKFLMERVRVSRNLTRYFPGFIGSRGSFLVAKIDGAGVDKSKYIGDRNFWMEIGSCLSLIRVLSRGACVVSRQSSPSDASKIYALATAGTIKIRKKIITERSDETSLLHNHGELSVDVRGFTLKAIDGLLQNIQRVFDLGLKERAGVNIHLQIGKKLLGSEPPAQIKPETIKTIKQAAVRAGVASGKILEESVFAGEDALVLQEGIENVGMIIVQSNGECHNIHEEVEIEHLVMGTKVLLSALWDLANK